jgi:hypothetical protein
MYSFTCKNILHNLKRINESKENQKLILLTFGFIKIIKDNPMLY